MASNSQYKEKDADKIEGTLFKLPFKVFGRVTVSLPLFSLIFCFVTAILFKFDDVNKTVCNVKNVIPSISAITGVTPQRYVWRICIALHCTPRFAVGYVYYNYYMERLPIIAPDQKALFKRLVRINFWVYTIENACLVGVSYIANVENYPLHEKIFIVFMITSLVYELVTIVLFRWTHPDPMSPDEIWSYKWKRVYFVTIMFFTAGLLYFFLRHRLYCEPGAFSFFSACEYGIAITNIGFHYTAATDFRGRYWYIGVPTSPQKKIQ